MSTSAERLIRSEKKTNANKVDESENEDEIVTYQRRNKGKLTKDDSSSTKSSLNEKPPARSEKRPLKDVYKLDHGEKSSISKKSKKPKQLNHVEKPMQKDQSLATSSLVERLRVRPDQKPLYKVDESDDEDEYFVLQKRRPKVDKPPEKTKHDEAIERPHTKSEKKPSDKVDGSGDEGEPVVFQRKTTPKAQMPPVKSLARSSMAKSPRDRSQKRLSYTVDDSDAEDQVPISERLKGGKKSQDDWNLKLSSSDKGLHIVDDSSDEDDVPIGHLKDKRKAYCPTKKSMQDNLNSTTSNYPGRHCARSGKRPSYNEDELDNEDEFLIKPKSGRQTSENTHEKMTRDDMKKDACQACGQSGDLIGCGTCTYSFHQRCLLPPQRAILNNSWSCTECANPLSEIEKILDSEMRPIASFKIDTLKHDQKQNCVRHYLVKWKGLSYLHCTWIAEYEFRKAFQTHPRLKCRLNNFKAKMESVDTLEDEFIAIRPEWTTVDRVIGSREKGNEFEYFVKWKELGYDECSWELESDISAFKPQIEKFRGIHARGHTKLLGRGKKYNQDKEGLNDSHKEFHHYDKTPEFLSGTLHPYQLEGLNFLRYSWSKKTHVILADEMGLGKTIQSIAFLASLYEESRTPHLVVAPLSTLRNWEREFATWAPEMNVVMYCGSASARVIARQYEFYYPKVADKKNKRKKSSDNNNKSKQRRIKFDVLLTSYEMINQDSTSLKHIQWESLIVDEGHRLKNKDSKLFLQLKLYSTKQRVLLTGTPLQNNLDELFMLMHFLDNGKFPSIEDFQKEFTDIGQEEQIERLHKMLAPHLLRRVKKDVMKDLPPKKELILRVDLSNKQKEYYKAILTRNYEILARRGGAQISLINVVMELRKLCCHAYMLEGVEPVVEPSDPNEGLRQLLESSGKMQLLDKMMVKLKEEGHRVLIYSQFQHMLDLLEDYLTYRKWSYERIDGKVSGAERQIRIDRFNADNSTRFCFLLSTRAGGLGINLATADTVIIYDSDWNPHADLQAMARAHRLGQINKVMIYRLITRGTIEERMMQLTKKKMILEHVVVGRLKAQKTVNQEELDDIIRYGSKELFTDENDEAGKSRQIHYDDAAIERLLNRDQIVGEEASIDDEDNDFLKTFKVANYEYIDEVEAAAAKELAMKQAMADKAASTNSDKASYWEDLLRDKYEVHQVETLNSLGKGKRSRKQLNNDPKQDASSEDEDHSYANYASDSETSSSGDSEVGRVRRKRTRVVDVESIPLMEGEGKSLKILGFNQYQRNVFVQTLMRFGFGDYDWKEFIPRLNGKTFEEVHEYGFLFLKHLDEGINDSPTYSDGVPKEGVRVEDTLVRLAQIRLISAKLKFLNDNPGSSLFPDDIKENHPSLIGKFWKEVHDIMLLKAILQHGYSRWQAIIDDKELGLVDVVAQELNLPSINRHTDNAASSNHSVNGFSEAGKGNESIPRNSAPYHHREQERRVSEFIRRRYQMLEKLLDLELCLDEDEKAHPGERASQDPHIEQMWTGVSNSIPVDTKSLLRELPILEPIAPAPVDLPFDNRTERLNMARLYNIMCNVMETNAPDAVESCLGNLRANSRLSKNMRQLQPLFEDLLRLSK